MNFFYLLLLLLLLSILVLLQLLRRLLLCFLQVLVPEHVDLEVVLPEGAVGAVGARIGSLPRVAAHVYVYLRRPVSGERTHRTREQLRLLRCSTAAPRGGGTWRDSAVCTIIMKCVDVPAVRKNAFFCVQI